jgi:tRNA (guanine37-N1)-methyltransferase
MLIKIFTLLPEVFNYLDYSILARAKDNKIWDYQIINIRDYTKDKYRKVDDVMFGGGGMLLKPDVLADAIDANCNESTKIYYMSPRGEVLKQQKAKEIAQNNKDIAIICGRYEGIDQRVIDYYNIEEISIGDYVLTGGELPAMVMIDACIRNLEGVIKKESLENESFSNILLEEAQYTHPREWRNLEVPEILINGNHKKIREWKLERSKELTREKRNDLWEKYKKKM